MTSTVVFDPGGEDGYQLCHPVNQGDFENIIVSVNGTPRLANWSPIQVEIISEDEGRYLAESDSPWLGPHALIFRRRAVDAMGTLLRDNGELLPLHCDDTELWMFNPTNLIDALDEELSQVVRFTGGRIMTIDRHVFVPTVVKDNDVFKIPRLRASPTFLSQRFYQAWQAAGLRGLAFRRIWPPEELKAARRPPRNRPDRTK